MEELKTRILKGIDYFWGIPPSKWTHKHHLLLVSFLKLLKEYFLNEPKSLEEQVEELKW